MKTPSPPARGSDYAIRLSGISKMYKLYKSKKSRLKEALHPLKKKYHREFYALRDINLQIERGESVGILGMNGAGKSTLLKVITRVITPTKGECAVKGHMSALLELGSGFNPEFSGYENVFFYGALMGLTEKQMNEKIEEILEFADIGEYIYQPIKTYSSGMKSRLAFAVATSIEPDILILDEVLSVGDMFFQAKCTLRMQGMIKNEKTTVLFVSHNINAVKAICRRCILLEGGRVIMDGPTQYVVNEYLKKQISARQKVIQNQIADPEMPVEKINIKSDYLENVEEFRKKASYGRVQNGKAEFLNVQLLDENENVINQVEYGQKVILRMAVKANEDINNLGYSFHLIEINGINILYGYSEFQKKSITNILKDEIYKIDWHFHLNLRDGNYSIKTVLSKKITPILPYGEHIDLIPIATQFTMMVRSNEKMYGYIYLDYNITYNKINNPLL